MAADRLSVKKVLFLEKRAIFASLQKKSQTNQPEEWQSWFNAPVLKTDVP